MTVLEPVIHYILSLPKRRNIVRLPEVMAGADRPRKPVLRVLDSLVREGSLKEIADDPIPPQYNEFGRARRNPTWEIIRQPNIPVNRPVRRTKRDRIWKAVRMKRRFTQAEIRMISGVSEGSVCDYIRKLVRVGCVRKIGKAERAVVYMLIKDTGPVRPAIKETQSE